MVNFVFRWYFILLVFVSVVFFAFGAALQWNRNASYEQPPVRIIPVQLPKPLFSPPPAEKPDSYLPFQLQFTLPELRVPNLAPFLSYYGINQRPDAPRGKVELFFSFSPSKEIVKLKSGEKYYLNKVQGGVALSPNNAPTSLWIVPSLSGNQAQLQVRTENSEGVVTALPESFAKLMLQAQPLTGQKSAWNVGKWRADSALLLRQKARWYGKDLFLEAHGGSEFPSVQGKQRISFEEGETPYAWFVEPGDSLVFQEGRWEVLKEGMKSEDLPLMQVQKVDDKVIAFELFSPSGAQKLLLNLVKTPESIEAQSVLSQFQFAGARTKVHSQFIISGKRELVGPGDWFLLLPEGWVKLKKVKEVDQYVEGVLKGPLLVVGEIRQQGTIKNLGAVLFSSGRGAMIDFEIPLIAHPVEKNEAPPRPVKEPEAPKEDQVEE